VNNLSLFPLLGSAAKMTYYLTSHARRRNRGPSAFKYTLHVDYSRINDPFEPNDTTDAPATITVGTPVTAYYYTGYQQYQIAATEFADWYQLELAGRHGNDLHRSRPAQDDASLHRLRCRERDRRKQVRPEPGRIVQRQPSTSRTRDLQDSDRCEPAHPTPCSGKRACRPGQLHPPYTLTVTQ
jgi:hypothetical protein